MYDLGKNSPDSPKIHPLGNCGCCLNRVELSASVAQELTHSATQKTQNRRGNHLSESSKFAILDTQRVRVTNDNFVHFANTAQLSTFHWVLQYKRDVQLTRVYTRDFQ